MVTCQLQAERRTGSVRRPKTGVPPTVLRNQRVIRKVWKSLLSMQFYSRMHQAFIAVGSLSCAVAETVKQHSQRNYLELIFRICGPVICVILVLFLMLF